MRYAHEGCSLPGYLLCLTISFTSLPTVSSAVEITLDSGPEAGGNGTVFSGLLLEGANCPDTGVVLFHGRGATPSGPVVEELRQSLNRVGYTTLSIENPLPLNGMIDFQSYVADADVGNGGDNFVFPEAYARARTAVNHLKGLGVQKVIMVGFSLGSRMAGAHVARGQIDELPVLGLIGVGMYANSIDPLNVGLTLDEISVPVLDIYGDLDTTAVNTAAARAAAYGGASMDYQAVALTCDVGVNCHQLEGLKGTDASALEMTVNGWMADVAPLTLNPPCASTVDPPVSDNGGGGGGCVLGQAKGLDPMLIILSLISLIVVVRRGMRLG